MTTTTAENHAILLNGARSAGEFGRALILAQAAAIAEERSVVDAIESLEFPDGSVLAVDAAGRRARTPRTVIVGVIDDQGRDAVLMALGQWANATECDIDAEGDVWVCNPQAGHWLDETKLAEFAKFLTERTT